MKTLRTVSAELGEPWKSKREDNGVWWGYLRGCYDVRNETTHEGRSITFEELDGALDAYEDLRRAVEDLTAATADTYPRTALMVHGPVGLAKRGALVGRVADELVVIQDEAEAAFWLPADLREVLKS
jgi:hypothetical protein